MNRTHSKGFIIGYAMIMSIVVLTIITAVIYFVSFSNTATTKMKYSNIAKTLSESGMEHALSQLRQNSARLSGINTIDKSVDCTDPRYTTKYYVELSTTTFTSLSDQLIVTVTSYGIIANIQTNKSMKYATHAYIQVNTLGDYFEMSTKTLKIGRGLDISNADIYGYDLIFLDDGSGTTTKINKAHYFNSAQNDKQPWVEIGGLAGIGARKLPMKFDLPSLKELIQMYEDLAGLTTSGTNTGILGSPNCTKGYGNTQPLEGNIYPPANGSGVYYSPNQIVIGNPTMTTTIHGQMIFVSMQPIIIKGDIVKCFEGRNHIDADEDDHIDCFSTWGPEYTVSYSTLSVPTSMVGFLSGSNVYVNKTDALSIVQSITIEAVVLASEGYFGAYSGLKMNSAAVLTFTGSIMIRDGINFAQVYTTPENRIYQYDTDLKIYELPHMPYVANIIYYHSQILENNLF